MLNEYKTKNENQIDTISSGMKWKTLEWCDTASYIDVTTELNSIISLNILLFNIEMNTRQLIRSTLPYVA